MGSQGRGEQTLGTDQDNAIIYADAEGEPDEKVAAYFLEFGKKMNRMLASCGYEMCKGGFMAGNPKWNQSLRSWRTYFHDWITTPEPQNLLDSSIFFDFRCIYGDESLTQELRKSIDQTLDNNPAFFGHMAKVCVNYKIPLGMFGKIQTESKENQENSINIKNAIRVIVNMVRMYAMQQHSRSFSTQERMLDLYSRNVISSALHADLSFSFEYLSMLQFRHQTKQFREMRTMDHYLDLAMLPGIETEMLKSVFSKLGTFQSKIRFDFGLGGN
jgi:CBS domain-containing protein